MKKISLILLFSGALVFFGNCVTNPIPLAFYGNYKGTTYVSSEKIGTKEGRTCMNTFGIGYLPLFAIGDASVRTAAANGGITKVSLVDFEQENFIASIYSKTCIVVYGE